jgi:hypothetical protein
MANQLWNLTLRFLLELAGWAAMGYWGWTRHEGIWRFVWAAGLIVVSATLWGVFRVAGEQHGKVPVAVPGPLRLLIEAAFFVTATYLLFDAGQPTAGMIFGGVVAAHYAVSYDRLWWLFGGPKPHDPGWFNRE